MKARITMTSASRLNKDEKAEYEKIGFEFNDKHWWPTKQPVINFKSLDELSNFLRDIGEVVVTHEEDGLFEIEIYNDYRE